MKKFTDIWVVVSLALLGLAAIMATVTFANAQAQTAPASQQTILDKLANIALVDVQSADAIAQANGDTVAHQCYAAVIDLLQKAQVANTPVPNLPKIAIITELQKARTGVNALRNTGPFFIQCAALKAQVKSDIGDLPAQGANAILGLLP